MSTPSNSEFSLQPSNEATSLQLISLQGLCRDINRKGEGSEIEHGGGRGGETIRSNEFLSIATYVGICIRLGSAVSYVEQ